MEKGNLKGVFSEVNAIQSFFDAFFFDIRPIQSRETLKEKKRKEREKEDFLIFTLSFFSFSRNVLINIYRDRFQELRQRDN